MRDFPKRIVKLYYRDTNKVFRAIDGIEASSNLIFIDTSVYTIASHLGDDSMIVLKKK